MRRQIVVGALVAACGQNPAWDVPTGTTGTGDRGSTSGPGLTEVAAPTGSETGDAGSATGGATTGVIGEATPTTGAAPTTDGSSGAGEPALVCVDWDTVPLLVHEDLISDAGVAPAKLVPCPWPGGPCEQLNFGITEYYRLLSAPDIGKNAAVIRFDIGTIDDIAAAHGRAPEDVHGFRLELVVYEPRDLPPVETTLRIDAPRQENVSFYEGTKAGAVAGDDESNELCQRRVAGQCVPWVDDAPVYATSVELGTIAVTLEAVAVADHDGPANGTYHATLRSTLLPIDVIREISGDGPPTFVVSLATERGLDPAPEIGIKLEDSPEPDPALFVEFCNVWE